MDVGGWLRGLGLGQYEEKFRDNKIDADLLPRLTVDDLKDIGVSIVGDRRRLLDAIAALVDVKPTANAPASPPRPSPVKGPEVSAERRPITVMFCDLVGSTSLAAKLDPEDWRNLVNAYLDEASKAVAALGGHVLKKLGDGLMALFGYPQAQENDAERAVRAALAIQRALAEINAKNRGKSAPELLARIGVESGPVVVEATGEVFGDAPNVAARVQAAAEPGSVLVTMNVQRQVAGLFVAEERGAQELKGLPEPVQLFRIIRASGARRRSSGRSLTTFVGREEELGLITRRWERARMGEGQLVLIVGEPGLGKSRLIEEFHTRLAVTPHTWTEWSASQLLQNTPLHPIAEWGRLRFGVDAPADQRLADFEGTLRLIGLDPIEYAPLLAPLVDIPLPPACAANLPPEELRRRQLAAMTNLVLAGARSQPVVLAFEDLHWADPTSLDLLRALADRGAQAPLLLLATTRPEFRAPWTLRSHHIVISLSPLDRAGVAQMVREISARNVLSREIVEGVTERTGGVPLFVEEVTRLLLERGEQGGVQTIPPTLQQSLAARLDRLGPAREIAQIGAVLGRDFGYTLLRDITDLDAPALQVSLDRLADADLLFVEGAPPQASYRFKHALIQDAAYDSLLKSRRQALHRRAAELLRDDPERAAAEPEVIAHHFTQAGLEDLAIEWWGKAGDQALRRSAFQEAIAHLGKAIEMADKAADLGRQQLISGLGGSSERSKLQSDYALAVMWSRGYGSEETKAAFARASELGGKTENAAHKLATYYPQWVRSHMRGEHRLAQATAETFLREAEEGEYATEASVARRALGSTCLARGNLIQARTYLERALEEYVPARDTQARFRFGHDPGEAAAAYLALAAWHLGEVERARRLAEQAVQLAAELGHLPTSANAHALQMFLETRRDDPAATLRSAEVLLALVRGGGMELYVAACQAFAGWARGRLYDAQSGAEELREALASYLNQGNKWIAPALYGLLAELEVVSRGPDSALTLIDQGLAIAGETDEHFSDPYLHRLRGDILLKCSPDDPAPAEEAYRVAIGVAKQQGARSYELLGSLSLARLYQATSRPADAHAVLAPALEGFSATPEMPEIAEAHKLLAALEETTEVRAAIAQRQRRLDLQTAYGHAVMWGKGFAAEETSAAFARVDEFAGQVKNTAGHFVAYFAQCQSSLSRGQLRLARETSETFLREAEAEGRATEAAYARSVLGLVLLNQGELKAARSVLERALADCDPRRDGTTGSRFWDAEVGATAELAAVEWHLGEAERARELINRAVRRAEGLSILPITVVALNWRAVLESQRHDVLATRDAADAVLALAGEHGVKGIAEFNWIYTHWARGQLLDPEAGAVGFRQELAAFMDKGLRLGAPFYHGLLAELEATARGPDSALTLIDHALAIAEETEQHLSDPYLHGLRGEILLRRDPSNPGPAEEAFQAAIAIARQQSARSWGLRAALSFAKLYQSTGRPIEAHAVLAPALEGFSPTPEMPEIAEAQALLAALSETEEVKAAEGQRQRRAHLQMAYGQAMMWAKGFSAEETRAAFSRATELTAKTDNFADRFAAGHFQWSFAYLRGELQSARELELSFLKEAEDTGRVVEAGVARRGLALACYQAADFLEARTHCERALEARNPENERETQERFQDATGPLVMSVLAVTMWQLGEVERAREMIEQANRRASELGHAPSMAHPLLWKSHLEPARGDPAAALVAAEALQGLGQEHGLPFWRTFAELSVGWARGRLHDAATGAEDLSRALADRIEQGALNDAWFYKGLLAELEAETLGLESALARIDEAMALARQVETRCNLPFLHLLRGKLLLERDPSNPAPAEEAFRTALAIAQEQGARSWGLRAALSLAKLYQSTVRPVDAHAVLAPALEGFSPTPEMPEIAEAQALLATFAEMGEVKVAIAQRQRRLDLQTSYALAVSFSKGSAADETKAAFERAGDLATRAEFPAERFSALFGHAYWSLQRGEVRAARDIAERILREAEADGRSSAFGDARRVLGLAFLFLGDLAKARSEFELALNSFDMESDSEARENFLWDAGAACRASLAQASWYSGDIHRARQLIKETIGSGRELGPPPSTAYVLSVKIYIEGHRNDLESVLADAENLLKVGQQHGMDFYVAISRIYLSWARGGLGDVRSGVDELRSSLDTYATQGNRLGTPYFLGCLAELEAAAGDDERALALIDEGLAMANEGGQQVWDAFLHRLRGDILLKRDPTKSAPAEEAYQTAIVIAKRQGARSYELLASFALAKLYQSSARPAEAYAVLAPALEGFSPTSEMPEIGEAQALLERLANGGDGASPCE